MIGISATSGCPGCDLTWIWPSPRAAAGPAAKASASDIAAARVEERAIGHLFTPTPMDSPHRCARAPTLAASDRAPQRSATGDDEFGDLHRVERRALPDVVRDDPEVQAIRVGQVVADAADEDRVVARGVRHRGWIAASNGLVDDFHARRLLQEAA